MQSLWVARDVSFGSCWWGQSGRCRRLSSFFLIFEASSFYWSIFLCWVFRFLTRSADLVVGTNLLLRAGFDCLEFGWLSKIFLMPRVQRKLWVVCSRVSRCLQWLLLSCEIYVGSRMKRRCLDQWSWNYFISLGGFVLVLIHLFFLGLFWGDWVNRLWCDFGLVCWCAGSVAPVPRFYVAEAGQSSQAGSTNKRPEQEAVVLQI